MCCNFEQTYSWHGVYVCGPCQAKVHSLSPFYFLHLLILRVLLILLNSSINNYILVFLSGRASREARGVRSVRPVPTVLGSGLWTAVPCLTREQEESQRH